MSLDDWDAPNWDADSDRLWFEVDHLGQPISCCIDALCLYLAFGARSLSELDAIHAYISRRGWIHSTALSKAHRGGFERSPGRPRAFIHLTARDL
jgi:hypothetical protein